MAKILTLQYNGNNIVTNYIIDNCAIIYNNATIKYNFTGTANLTCNNTVMRTDVSIGNLILLPCTNKDMSSNITANAVLPTIWANLNDLSWSKMYNLTWNQLVEA